MPFNFGLFSSTLLVFFFHGIVFSGLVWLTGRAQQVRSAGWLGLLLLLLALYISPFMLGYAGWYGLDGYREALFYLPLQQVLVIGPVMLFYLNSLLYPRLAISPRDWLHFLPGLLYLLYSLAVFLADLTSAEGLVPDPDGKDKDFDPWYQIAGFISLTAYFAVSLARYQRYKKQIFDQLSYAEEVAYRWVRAFLVVFLVILLLRALFFVLNPEWDAFGRKYWYYLSVSAVGYFLAIQGYRQTLLLGSAPLLKETPQHLSSPEADPAPAASASDNPDFDAPALLARIEEAMKLQHLYQNPALTLSDLATLLDTTTRNISQAINKGAGVNFNDYVNRLRVAAVVRELENGAHRHHTLLGIAFSCGFNSKSTFNRAFKKITGANPADFLQNHLKDSAKS